MALGTHFIRACALLSLTLIACGGESTPPDDEATRSDDLLSKRFCRPTGCSGQVCADQDIATTCEWREEYACYRAAECKRQSDGACGFTQTAELEACLGAGGGALE